MISIHRSRNAWLVRICAVLLSVSGLAGTAQRAMAVAGPTIGSAAPDFVGIDSNGKSIALRICAGTSLYWNGRTISARLWVSITAPATCKRCRRRRLSRESFG